MLWIASIMLVCGFIYRFLKSDWVTFRTNLQQARQAAERRDWSGAEAHYARAMRAVNMLKARAKSAYLPTAAVGLAKVFYQRGKLDKAGELLSALIQTGSPASRPKSIEFAMALDTLGQIRLDQGRYAEAQNIFEQALRLGESMADKVSISMELQRLADAFLRQSQFEQAEQVLLRASAVETELATEQFRREGRDLTKIVVTSFSQPEIYFSQKKWSNALSAFQDKVSYWERAVTRPDNVDLGALQMRLADIHGRLGDLPASIGTYQRAIETLKRDWTEGHPKVAVCLAALATAREAGDHKNRAAAEALEALGACGLDAHPAAQECRDILQPPDGAKLASA